MSDTTPISGIAERYAAALFELADESGALETVEGQLRDLGAALADSAELRSLIASPVYTREQQQQAMAAVLGAMGVGAPTANLVGLMAQKRRLFALPDVIRAFQAMLRDRRGIVTAEVTSAARLSDAQQAELQGVLRKAVGADVDMKIFIDEGLIGGLVVKVGSKMIDTSIRSRLNRIETIMKEAGI
ncbi:MAG: F0F1 ATP synthase subunit delta [Rubrimonas sp.]